MSNTTSPAIASQSPGWDGLWIPLVTPFDRAGAVDHPALAALVHRLRGEGVRGFVACGSTGEAAALSHTEQRAPLETVLAAARSLPVVMGLSGYHLGDVLARVRSLAHYPLAGLLVPAPHYIRPGQDGLVHWFNAIADASAAPVIVYDIPYRTGSTLALETLRALAAHPRIQAVKDCGGDMAKTQALIADGRLAVLAGEDAQIFATLAAGGAGVIAANAHCQTARFAELMTLVRVGDLPRARRTWQALQPWIAACFAEPNPAPLKAALARAGEMHNVLRPPMMPASSAPQRLLAALDGEGGRSALSRP